MSIVGLLLVIAGLVLYTLGMVFVFDGRWTDVPCDDRVPLTGAVLVAGGVTALGTPVLFSAIVAALLAGTFWLLHWLAERDKRRALNPSASDEIAMMNEMVGDMDWGWLRQLRFKLRRGN